MDHSIFLVSVLMTIFLILFGVLCRILMHRADYLSTIFYNSVGQSIFFTLDYLDTYIENGEEVTIAGVNQKLEYLSKNPIYNLKLAFVSDYSTKCHAVEFRSPYGVLIHRALYNKSLFD